MEDVVLLNAPLGITGEMGSVRLKPETALLELIGMATAVFQSLIDAPKV